MAMIGAFYRGGFDPGAYTTALFHAQKALAGTPQHRLSVHTFAPATLKAVAEAAPDIEGLMVFGAEGADLDFLCDTTRPAVICERVVAGCNYVAPDNFHIGRTAAEHLLRLGHQTLAVALPGIPGDPGDYQGPRLQGFLETAAQAGRPVDERDVLFGEKSRAGGAELAVHLLRRPALPQALFMQNWSQLMGVSETLRQRGVRVPQDISVIGTSFQHLNGYEPAEHLAPPLTTVTFSKEEMGRRAAGILVDALSGGPSGIQQILLPGILAERGSTAAPTREGALAR